MTYARVIMAAQRKDIEGTSEPVTPYDAWAAVIEVTLVTFFISFITEMLALGGPPATLAECWKPVLASLLMALYTYSRARGIVIPDEVREDVG